jgi:hypothetical protein
MRPLPMQRLHPLCWVALTPTTERAAIKLGVSVFNAKSIRHAANTSTPKKQEPLTWSQPWHRPIPLLPSSSCCC